MQCNIDAKGKAVRLMAGAAVEAFGLFAGALWFFGVAPDWSVYPAIGAAIGGLFMIFEGLSGWCAIRAMGFKTPL